MLVGANFVLVDVAGRGSGHVFPANFENGDESFSRYAVGTHIMPRDRRHSFPVSDL